MPRITAKYLVDFCNEKFKEFEITKYKVVEVYNARNRRVDIEAGACQLVIRFENIKTKDTDFFFCFYSMSQLQNHLKNGHKLTLKFAYRSKGFSLSELELDVTK